jgi:4a-hydroxytetrahydrobiopterin dehydratase
MIGEKFKGRRRDFFGNTSFSRNLLVTLTIYSGRDWEVISETTRLMASKKCGPCKDAVPFTVEQASERLKALPGWVLQSGSIKKEFRFKSYLSGLEFACSLGRIAELEDHHPDMLVGWRRVTVMLSTHAIKGLSVNDFIMAAKSELEYSKIGGS